MNKNEFHQLVIDTIREVARDNRVATVTIHYEEKCIGRYGNTEAFPRVRIEYRQPDDHGDLKDE